MADRPRSLLYWKDLRRLYARQLHLHSGRSREQDRRETVSKSRNAGASVSARQLILGRQLRNEQ